VCETIFLQKGLKCERTTEFIYKNCIALQKCCNNNIIQTRILQSLAILITNKIMWPLLEFMIPNFPAIVSEMVVNVFKVPFGIQFGISKRFWARMDF